MCWKWTKTARWMRDGFLCSCLLSLTAIRLHVTLLSRSSILFLLLCLASSVLSSVYAFFASSFRFASQSNVQQSFPSPSSSPSSSSAPSSFLFPVSLLLGHNGSVSVIDPVTGAQRGHLNVLLAAGTYDQVSILSFCSSRFRFSRFLVLLLYSLLFVSLWSWFFSIRFGYLFIRSSIQSFLHLFCYVFFFSD